MHTPMVHKAPASRKKSKGEQIPMGNMVDAGGPLTTIVTWKILKGHEKQFETWRHKIEAAAIKFPGHMGVNLLVPNNSSREYTVVFRFDTYEHLRAWQESDTRRELLKEAEQFQDSNPEYRTEEGLAYWFVSPKTPVPPPRWKMSIVTLIGVWPLSMLIPMLLQPIRSNLPAAMTALLVSAGIVVSLSWIVMPILVKILRPWLEKN